MHHDVCKVMHKSPKEERGEIVQTARVVQQEQPHRMYRGDTSMKYAATYQVGNATVHVVAPKPQTEEEKAQIIKEYQRHFLRGWNALPEERRLEINARHESTPKKKDSPSA